MPTHAPIVGATGLVTTLQRVSSTTKSLKTTVPVAIVQQLGLAAGDRLQWQMRVVDGELSLVVSPEVES